MPVGRQSLEIVPRKANGALQKLQEIAEPAVVVGSEEFFGQTQQSLGGRQPPRGWEWMQPAAVAKC